MAKQTRSELEIARWTKIIENNFAGSFPTAQARLSAYLGSLIIGRTFGETVEAHFEKKNLTQFVDWATKAANNGL